MSKFKKGDYIIRTEPHGDVPIGSICIVQNNYTYLASCFVRIRFNNSLYLLHENNFKLIRKPFKLKRNEKN